MKTLNHFWVPCVLALAALLTGCGGGGGDAGEPAAPAQAAEAATAAARDLPLATLAGDVTFDAIPNDKGALAYDAIVRKPARGVIVELIDDAPSVVARTVTDAAGHYTAQVPTGRPIVVRVVARMQQLGTGPAWDTRIADNTQFNAVYSMESEALVVHAEGAHQDLHAGSGWDGSGYSGARLAGIWAMLDTVYIAQQKVLAIAPDAVFPPLALYWSPGNVPASGNVALGQIGTTSFALMGLQNAIFVLGKEDVDTDEFDVSVIAHEWGHYFQHAFSRDDSVGGNHAAGDLLDPRVAFSEGWGNAWSGIALERSTYTDSFGKGQAKGLSIDLAAGPIGSAVKGWFNEQSIQQVLWQLNADQGFGAIFAALTDAAFASGGPLTSIHSFNAVLKAVSASAATHLAPLLAAQRIHAQADGWGAGETTSGGSSVALPMYQALVAGGTVNACVSNRLGAAAGDNKLGNHAFVRLTVPASRIYRLTVSGGGIATDPDFQLYGPAGSMSRADTVAPSTETLPAYLETGTYVLAVTDYNNSAANTCFAVSVN